MKLEIKEHLTRLTFRVTCVEKNGMIYAEVDEILGCKAKGKTEDELYDNLQVAIRKWLDVYNESGKYLYANMERMYSNESKRWYEYSLDCLIN